MRKYAGYEYRPDQVRMGVPKPPPKPPFPIGGPVCAEHRGKLPCPRCRRHARVLACILLLVTFLVFGGGTVAILSAAMTR